MTSSALFAGAILSAIVTVHVAPVRCTGEFVLGDTRVALPPSGTAALDIPLGFDGAVELRSPDCWAAPAELRDRAEIMMRTWPLTEIGGPLRLPRGVETVEIEGEVAVPGITSTKVRCAVSKDAWNCLVPETTFDLKLVARGYVPAYLWGIEPAKWNRETAFVVERGGSVSGWVVAEDGAPMAGATLRLAPAALARAKRPETLRVQSVAATARGFFQFRGVAAGDYTLEARKADHAVGRTTIAVHDNTEAVVQALEIPPLARVDLHVTPPADSIGKPWHVSLSRRELLDRSMREVARGKVAADGQWVGEKLDYGAYLLAVEDGGGSIFFERQFEIDRSVVVITAEVASVPIVGSVRSGDVPIEADLRFEAEAGVVSLKSNERGEFSGSLPADGDWNIAITRSENGQATYVDGVRVHKSTDGPARVDVLLPATYVSGKVVSDAGVPVTDGVVYAMRRGALVAHAKIDRSGAFELIGFKPGEILLIARTSAGDSAEIRQTVSEDTAAPVTLVVSKSKKLNGRVAFGAAGVAGAIVRWVGAGGRALETSTGPDGRFLLELPKDVEAIPVVVIAAGFPLKVATVDLQHAEIELKQVSGRLRVAIAGAPPWPSIRHAGRAFPLFSLFRPRHDSLEPAELADDAVVLDLEPGPYTVCFTSRCEQTAVFPGKETLVDSRIKEPSS